MCEQVDPATAGPRAVISEGQRVPAGPWRPEAGGPWAASLPAGAPVLRHVRTLWVSGVKVSCDSWAQHGTFSVGGRAQKSGFGGGGMGQI